MLPRPHPHAIKSTSSPEPCGGRIGKSPSLRHLVHLSRPSVEKSIGTPTHRLVVITGSPFLTPSCSASLDYTPSPLQVQPDCRPSSQQRQHFVQPLPRLNSSTQPHSTTAAPPKRSWIVELCLATDDKPTMTSAIPVHTYHPPRHPHAIAPTTPTPIPRSSTAASYYTASSTSTLHTSYWPNGPSSSFSTTSSASPRLNAGLAAAQYVTKHTTGRLHRRARSGTKTPEEIPDEMFDEGFFSGPGSPPPAEIFSKPIKSKNKIKPLLKKVSVSRNNSLDLSRSDGGLPNGVGLGIFDTPPGYESSGVDEEVLETAFPRHPRKRHQRNVSGLSVASANSPLIPGVTPTQPFAHPKRQVPRRGVYTPDLSRDGTSNESSDNSEDERETRRIVLSGSSRRASATAAHARSLTISTSHESHSTPVLVNNTTSMTDLHSFSRGVPTPSSQLTSPVTPVSPVESLSTPQLPVKKQRGRHLTSKDSKRREASPSFAASVTAARLAWEAKEEKKEEKREKKRRRSEAKEGERRTVSQNSCRDRGNSGSSAQTVWDADTKEDREPGYREKGRNLDDSDDDEVFTGRGTPVVSQQSDPTCCSGRKRNATGKKWSVLSAEQSRKESSSQKHVSLKKRWLGFIVWVRIGMVRLGRKMGF